ncbi:cyclodeaminase [Paramyrothecium foliicola]|nr:cyclodeaminase [Paramyrothecium foliicola]
MAAVQHLHNDAIHDLLINLSKDEAINFRNIVEKTFEDFSAGGERQIQPEPCASNRPDGRRILFRGFSSDVCVGTKIVVEPPTKANGTKDPLRGTILLMDGQGIPTSILDAEEVTGYRTSMNVMVPFSWRKKVDKIVIFGTGMQALWHSRLILRLRGPEVKTITYVGVFKSQADEFIAKISGENDTNWKASVSFDFLDATSSDFQKRIETRLSDVDCVFCTTPSRKPLFPARYLTKRLGNGANQPLVSAIGSWQTDMIELDPELLRTVATSGGYNPETGTTKGAVLVDDRNYALLNSGEMVQSKVTSSDLVELGHIVALRNGKTQPVNGENVADTNRFISEGFVVYKSIGVSTTDLTVADAIQTLIQSKQSRL